MKTSNYIITAFLVFFVGTVLAIHIDSKLYEPEYKKIVELRKNYYKIYGYNSFNNKEKLTLERWNEFIEKATLLNTKENLFPGEIVHQANIVYHNYKKFNDTEALKKAAFWCELAYSEEPCSYKLNSIYANILFDLGFVEQAIDHMKIAIENSLSSAQIYDNLKRLKVFENELIE